MQQLYRQLVIQHQDSLVRGSRAVVEQVICFLQEPASSGMIGMAELTPISAGVCACSLQ